jgi:2'-5' RNA ligase
MAGFSYANAVASSSKDTPHDGGGGSSIRTQASSSIAGQLQGRNDSQSSSTSIRQVATSSAFSQRAQGSPYMYPPEQYPAVIISLWLDDELQHYFSNLRSKYFPTSKNYLQGHISLFHALPSEELDFISNTVTELCKNTSVFPVHCDRPRPPRNSSVVAISLKAVPLVSLRQDLLGTFSKNLEMIDQDLHRKFWPHATLVNKVTNEEAIRVWEEVRTIPEEEQVRKGTAKGLDMWFYRGGPWEHIRRVSFSKNK